MSVYTPPPAEPSAESFYAPPQSSPELASAHSTPEALAYAVVKSFGATRIWAYLGGACYSLFSLLCFFAMIKSISFSGGSAAISMAVGILALFPATKLFSYGKAVGRLQQSLKQDDLLTAIQQQRAFWIFTGICALLWILIIGFAFLINL